MHLVYTTLLVLGLVVSIPYYAARFRKYLPTMGERLGFVTARNGPRPVWIHAVSVGEMRAVDALIRRLRQDREAMGLVVSTTTPTGRQLALERADLDQVIYFPLDLPGSVTRSLDRIRPEMVIMAETEIWPNFLRVCRQRQIPVFMVNGRISDRSFPRYRRVRRWLGPVLANYALLGMQSEEDAARIRALGAPEGRTRVLGNLKYDLPELPGDLDPLLRRTLAAGPGLVVAASTAEGEESRILDAFRRVAEANTPVRFMIAPRRPEQFDAVARALDEGGLSWCRRSSLNPESGDWRFMLLDSVGELSAVMELASVVFIGGTLVARGGHNILEAARFGKPVIFGPHMENFRDMARQFLRAGAALEVRDGDELAGALGRVLGQPELGAGMARAARQVIESNSGATARTLAAIFESSGGDR